MPELSTELDELNERLDTCACLFIESYQDLLEHRTMLDKCLDGAYLNLSKARSIIGCTSLSILQVPVELAPIVTVETSTRKLTTKTDDPNFDFEYSTTNFDLIVKRGLKQTNKNEDYNDIDKLEVKQDSNLIPFPNWFGAFAPLSLKTSQKSFARSLYLITSICQLQAKITYLQTDYKKMMLQKESIESTLNQIQTS